MERKIEENTTKQKDVTAISTLLSTLKTSTSAIGSENTYLKRKVDVSGDSAKVSVSSWCSGAKLHARCVKRLAQKDVYQSVVKNQVR